MKRHSKNNRNASNAGNVLEVQAGLIIHELAERLSSFVLEKLMKDELHPTGKWAASFVTTTCCDYFYNFYKREIESAKQKGIIKKELFNLLLELAPTAANTFIEMLTEKINDTIKEWGFPEMMCDCLDKDTAKTITNGFTLDLILVLVLTNDIPNVGDVLGSWVVVKKEDNGKIIHVSNGTNEIKLKNVAFQPTEDGSISKYCWTRLI